MSFSKKRHLTEVNQKLEQYFFESKNNHNNRDIISEQSSPLLYRSCGKLGIYSYGCVDVKPEEKNIIKQVQKCLGITKADGYFGPKTLNALESKFPNTEGVFTVADFKTICGKEWVGSSSASGGASDKPNPAITAQVSEPDAIQQPKIQGEQLNFPISFNHSYNTSVDTGTSVCDKLHAFQGTKRPGTGESETVGDLHILVQDELEKIYNKGYNPIVTDVTVKVTKQGQNFQVDCNVTINESKDGNAWLGFTSRGAGCGGSRGENESKLRARAKSNSSMLPQAIRAQFEQAEVRFLKEIFNTEGGDGFWFVQNFYIFTDPIDRPARTAQNTEQGSAASSVQPQDTTVNQAAPQVKDLNFRTRKDVDNTEFK